MAQSVGPGRCDRAPHRYGVHGEFPPALGGQGGDPVAAAYDAIAAEYDAQVAGDAWMRRVLWARYAALFRPGRRVLDVGCGSGADAIFLARRGVRVTGIDVSPAMIARLEGKVRRLGLAGLVEARVMDVADLAAWHDRRFDGIVSAFAGLSTAPDLARFAADAARLLPPGAPMVLHLLNRTSLWEWLAHVAARRWPAARALRHQRERVFVIGGRPVRHYLYRPDEAYRAFAGAFRLRRRYGLGALRPPHTLRRLPPPLIAVLDRLEVPLRARRPLADWGRFFVLELDRTKG
ncbi:MAG TPA: class I SAM-dependent methyltransferase [Thermomicrobiales bacterium]|nr:class I SAM-dependent methyltransferase [Thermomicrobiales bacterium]